MRRSSRPQRCVPRLFKAWFLVLFLALSLSSQAFEPFRFAVVTDVHINVNAENPTEDLRQTVAAING